MEEHRGAETVQGLRQFQLPAGSEYFQLYLAAVLAAGSARRAARIAAQFYFKGRFCAEPVFPGALGSV
jgi:hypothetical protein